jgi:hypothetical protein
MNERLGELAEAANSVNLAYMREHAVWNSYHEGVVPLPAITG